MSEPHTDREVLEEIFDELTLYRERAGDEAHAGPLRALAMARAQLASGTEARAVVPPF